MQKIYRPEKGYRAEKFVILDNNRFVVSNIEDTVFIERALFFEDQEHAHEFKKNFCTTCAKVLKIANKSYR